MTIALKQVSEEPIPPRGAQPGGAAGARRGGAARAAQGPGRALPGRRRSSSPRSSAAMAGLRRAGRARRGPGRRARGGGPPQLARGSRSIALVVLALAALAVGARTCCSRRSRRRCPNVVGKRSSAAAQKLQDARLRGRHRADPVRHRGRGPRRRASAPSRATEADEGSTVTITVSSGPGEAPVPLVQGLPADEAADAAPRGRLQVRAAARVLRHRPQRARDRDVAAGGLDRAQGLDGHAGRLARQGEGRRCPTSSGSSRDEAERLLRDAGLEAAVTERESGDEDPGTVLEQDPGGRDAARQGRDGRRSSSPRRRPRCRCPT